MMSEGLMSSFLKVTKWQTRYEVHESFSQSVVHIPVLFQFYCFSFKVCHFLLSPRFCIPVEIKTVRIQVKVHITFFLLVVSNLMMSKRIVLTLEDKGKFLIAHKNRTSAIFGSTVNCSKAQ